MARGIVIGPKVAENSFDGSVDRDQLTKWLLYWDKIVYAGIGFNGPSITGKHPDDFLHLEELGVFRTEVVDIQTLGNIQVPYPKSGGNIFGIAMNQFPVVSSALRLKLCENLSQQSNDVWALGQSGGENLILPFENGFKELIDIQIYDKLPVPSQDTPFKEILEYKAKYQGELQALRFYLDQLRDIVLRSQDEKRALEKVLYDLSVSLENIRKSMLAKRINTLSDTISLYTNNPSNAFWGMLGAAAGAAYGFPVAVTSAAALAIPTTFKFIKRNIVGGRNLPNQNEDFSYLINMKNELR